MKTTLLRILRADPIYLMTKMDYQDGDFASDALQGELLKRIQSVRSDIPINSFQLLKILISRIRRLNVLLSKEKRRSENIRFYQTWSPLVNYNRYVSYVVKKTATYYGVSYQELIKRKPEKEGK